VEGMRFCINAPAEELGEEEEPTPCVSDNETEEDTEEVIEEVD
jgi:hypothetical protein